MSIVDAVLMVGIFAVSFFVGGCSSQLELASGSMTYMKCHWAFMACGFIAIIGFASSLVCSFAKGMEARRMIAFVTLVTFAIIAIIPSGIGIGICAGADMACHMTGYATWAMCAVGAILSIIQMVRSDPASSERPKMQL